MSRGARLRAALLTTLLAVRPLPVRAQPPESDGWSLFTATWNLSGERQLLPTEGGRHASVVHLSGSMTVKGGEGIGRGFLVEMIGFDDGATLLVGRSVLTDEHADRIYCTLKADTIGAGRRGTGTITGGSGRYAETEGSYTFTWQYVVDAGSGEISVRSVNLEGRIRRAPPPAREAKP
ncbi:MAG: hypothetical protein ACM3JH_09675 [Acidithiobacillales bacterium]